MTTKQKLTKFIKKRPYLIWWVKKYEALDAAAIVEATLNYGDWDDVRELIKILGMKETARIFREKSKSPGHARGILICSMRLEHVRKPHILLDLQNFGCNVQRLTLVVSSDTPRSPPGRLARNSAISRRKRVSGHALRDFPARKIIAHKFHFNETLK